MKIFITKHSTSLNTVMNIFMIRRIPPSNSLKTCRHTRCPRLNKMPKYYCDYCDTYLTHDSPSVRKTHCAGRKHKDNVKFYYQKWMEDQAQSLIDATTAAFKAGKIPSNPFGGTAKGGAAIPPPSILQTRPGMPPPASGPPGQPPPLLGPPGGRPPMLPPGMMMPPGGPPPGGAPGLPPGMPGMPPGMPPGMLASLNRLRPPMGMPPLMPPPGMGGLIPRPLIPQPTNTAPPTSQSM